MMSPRFDQPADPSMSRPSRHVICTLVLLAGFAGCGKGTQDELPSGGIPQARNPSATPKSTPAVGIRPFPKESRIDPPVPIDFTVQQVGDQVSSEARRQQAATAPTRLEGDSSAPRRTAIGRE